MDSSAAGERFVFVDWAGDPGFKFRQGSSSHLVVVAVFTSRYRDVKEGLRAFREERQLGKGSPFHYADASRSLRLGLAAVLASLPFVARVIVVDKAELNDVWRQMRGDTLVEHLVAETVVGGPPELIANALLIVDGARRNTKQLAGLRVAISRRLAENALPQRLRRAKARPAAEEDGLQIADVIAGMALAGVGGRASQNLAEIRGKIEIVLIPPKSAHK